MRVLHAAPVTLFLLTGCAMFIDYDRLASGPACEGEECGSSVPDAGRDRAAPAIDGAVEVDATSEAEAGVVELPAFLQSGVANLKASTVPTTIGPTKPGNLIAVAIAIEEHDLGAVSGITDNAPGGSNEYVSAKQKSIDLPCNDASEIWYAKNVRPGATIVTVAITGAPPPETEVWVMEFSGLSRTAPLEGGAVATNPASVTTVTAPSVATSAQHSVVISTACACDAITSIKAGTPFLALPILVGENTAYYIASQPGSYGAVWTSTPGSFNASTVIFK
jgi:hypothetical protein